VTFTEKGVRWPFVVKVIVKSVASEPVTVTLTPWSLFSAIWSALASASNAIGSVLSDVLLPLGVKLSVYVPWSA
jgi:hypothetical protein